MDARRFTWSSNRRKKLAFAAIILSASFAIVIGVQIIYLNYFQPYANLVVAQVDPKLFELFPQYAQFSQLQHEEQVFDEHPKLKGAFGKVQKEFDRIVLECPPREAAVYCDLESNTRITSSLTPSELHSLLQSPDINFYGTMPDAEWIAFVTRDGNDCYPVIPSSNADELAKTYGTGDQKCYYTIMLERTYYDTNPPFFSPGHNLVMPVR